MKYSKSLRAIGFIHLVSVFILLSILLIIDEYFIVQYQKYIYFWNFAKIVCKIVCILMLLRSIILIIVGGSWKIELTEDHLLWQVPSKSNFFGFKSDDSFSLNLSDISCVISDQGSNDFSGTTLIFLTHSGNKFIVSDESGISLNKFEKKLKKYGVTVRYKSGYI